MIRKIFTWILIIILAGISGLYIYVCIYMLLRHVYDVRMIPCYTTSIFAAYAAAKVYYTEFKE